MPRRMKTVSVILSTLPLSETERFFYRPKAWSYHNLPGQVNRRHGEAEDLPDLTNTITDGRMSTTEP